MSITIIIPVFNAPDETRQCLNSVHRTSRGANVIVIDDASTAPGLAAYLQEWCNQEATYHLHANSNNLGFVQTVNRGMSLAQGNVVLLNSDTLVTNGWLESLARCLDSDPEIATATPWSNNAEIASFPVFCENNPIPADPEVFAQAARKSATGEYPELPTAVGFCMAISRRALNCLGGFDAETFGKGYGEENDFSLRASHAGLRNVLCCDSYVVHRGGASFGPEGLKPDESSMRRLLGKHPHYLEEISKWIINDPLAVHRQAMHDALKLLLPD